jgi:predicted nucleic acid-binding protein
MIDPRRVYWDACAWLGLLNGESEKLAALQHVWGKASKGEVEIWTSAFCLAEVYKAKCEGGAASLGPEGDQQLDDMFDQDFVKVAQVDSDIGRLARRLLRSHAKLKKPSDAIHLATAVHWDLEQLHTYDGSDLLGLVVKTSAGNDLEICKPDMLDGEDLFNRPAGGGNG